MPPLDSLRRNETLQRLRQSMRSLDKQAEDGHILATDNVDATEAR